MSPITTSTPRSHAMKSSLSEFLPKDLIHIVDDYFAYSDATEVLTFDVDGKMVDSELNRQILEAAKYALTTGTCDREIIRLIFKNAIDHGYTGFLNMSLMLLRYQHYPLIFDGVNFSDLNLSKIKFDGASIKKANFDNANLMDASFAASDLSGSYGFSTARGMMIVNGQTGLADTAFNIVNFDETMEAFRNTTFILKCGRE